MRIAVVTPYYKEPTDILRRCHDSVMAQTCPVTHIMVSDGHPNPEVDQWNAIHVRLPGSQDTGDTPRAIGALLASSMGFDAISLLDADNWFEHDHIASLLALQQQTGVQVVTCARTLRREDETILGPCHHSDGQAFNDTNCYLVMRSAFYIFSTWGFKRKGLDIVGDQIFWNTLVRAGFSRAHQTRATVNYVTLWGEHYLARGEPLPPNAKAIYENPPQNFRIVPYLEYQDIMARQAETAKVAPPSYRAS